MIVVFVYLHTIRVQLSLVHFSNSFHLLLVPHLPQVFLQFLLIQRLCALFLELQVRARLPQSLLLSRHCLAGPSKENDIYIQYGWIYYFSPLFKFISLTGSTTSSASFPAVFPHPASLSLVPRITYAGKSSTNPTVIITALS